MTKSNIIWFKNAKSNVEMFIKSADDNWDDMVKGAFFNKHIHKLRGDYDKHLEQIERAHAEMTQAEKEIESLLYS